MIYKFHGVYAVDGLFAMNKLIYLESGKRFGAFLTKFGVQFGHKVHLVYFIVST